MKHPFYLNSIKAPSVTNRQMNKNYFFQAAILLSQAPSQIYRQTILGYFHHSKRHAYKKPDDLQSIAKLIRFLI